MTVAQTVARNSMVQLAGRGVTMVASLLTLMLLSRYLGPHGYGQYQIVIAFLFITNFSDLGVNVIAVRHLSQGERSQDDIMANVVTLRAIMAGVSTLVAMTAAVVLGGRDEVGETVLAIAVASLSFPLSIFFGAYTATFQANLRMEYVAVSSIAQAWVSLGGMTLVAVNGGGLVLMLVAYNAGALTSSIVSYIFVRRFITPRFGFDPPFMRSLVRDSLPIAVAALLTIGYDRLGVLLLKWLTDNESVGFYGFAYRAIDLAVPLAVLFVGSVFPIMSNYFAEGNIERFKSLYQRCHDLITLGGMAMVTGVVLFAEPMVQLLGGDEYHQAVTVLRVLAMAVPPIWLGVLADYGLVATGRQNVLLWLAGLSMLTNLAANLILIPIYGKEGAAASTVIGEFAMLMPALFLLGRAMGETPSFWVAGRLLPVSGVVALLAYALPLWWVPEALIVGTLFGVGVAAMRVISVDDLKLLLRRAEPEIMPVEVGAGN
jgi:O-antigen/teichoic acid export membrane protein